MSSSQLTAVALCALLASMALAGCGSSNSTLGAATVSTLAGSSEAGTTDGPASVARFSNPVNVALDADANLFVADFDSNRVRRITPAGSVSTVVNQALFQRPFGLAVTPSGGVFVQTDDNDLGEHSETTGTIWRVDPVARTATRIASNLGRPRGLCALSDGRLVLSDVNRHTVSLMDPGTGAVTPLAGAASVPGFHDGSGATARFDRPYGVATLPGGDLLVADQNNHRIRRITPGGMVTTYAGDGTPGLRDGDRLQARFNFPQALAADAAGNVFVSDSANHLIRRIGTDGRVSTVAGNGTHGFRDGPGAEAEFFGQEGIAVPRDGTRLYVADGTGGGETPADQLFQRIRLIEFMR